MRTLAVLAVAALFLSGCAAEDGVPGPAGTFTTTSLGPLGSDFLVAAAYLQPGQRWMHSVDLTGKASGAGFSFEIDEHLTMGYALLSSGYARGSHDALVGVQLLGEAGERSFDAMLPVAAVLVDAEDNFQADLGDMQFLRDCQADPSKCPKDLAPHAVPAESSPGVQVTLRFPLQPGMEWDHEAGEEGVTGSLRLRVLGSDKVNVLGAAAEIVRIQLNGTYQIEQEIEGDRVSGTIQVDGTLDYSPAHAAVTARRIHEVDDFDFTSEGRKIHIKADVTVRTALVDMELASAPSLDAVELYEALELGGRRITVGAERAGPGKVAVAVQAEETPLAGIVWSLKDPQGTTVEEGTGLAFELALGAGAYDLEVRGEHKGVVLVEESAQLTADGIIEDDDAGTPVDVNGTVACDAFVLRLPGAAHGECEPFGFDLGDGLRQINATSTATTVLPDVKGTLELLDPSGAVRASAETTASGSVGLTVTSPLEAGTWQARFTPETGLQMSVTFHVTAH